MICKSRITNWMKKKNSRLRRKKKEGKNGWWSGDDLVCDKSMSLLVAWSLRKFVCCSVGGDVVGDGDPGMDEAQDPSETQGLALRQAALSLGAGVAHGTGEQQRESGNKSKPVTTSNSQWWCQSQAQKRSTQEEQIDVSFFLFLFWKGSFFCQDVYVKGDNLTSELYDLQKGGFQ